MKRRASVRSRGASEAVSRIPYCWTAHAFVGRAAGCSPAVDGAAAGDFPLADGSVEILAQPADRDAGVLGFTAHAVVFADADPGWVAAQLPPDDLAAPLSASFLHTLGVRLGRSSHSVDLLTCAESIDGPPDPALRLTELPAAAMNGEATHPRMLTRIARCATGLRCPGVPADQRRSRHARPRAGRPYRGLDRSRAGQPGRRARTPTGDGGPAPPPGRRGAVGTDSARQRGERAGVPGGRIPPGRRPRRCWPRRHPLARPHSNKHWSRPAMSGMSDVAVTDNQGDSRLEIHADGELAQLLYRTRAGRLILVHTEVPEALEGRGLGGELVRAAIGKATAEGTTQAVPLCPFARAGLSSTRTRPPRVPIDWDGPVAPP